MPDRDATGHATQAERTVAAHAARVLDFLRVARDRHGMPEVHAQVLAARLGVAYRTGLAALEYLEARGAVRCVAVRGRGVWALADGDADADGDVMIRQLRQQRRRVRELLGEF